MAVAFMAELPIGEARPLHGPQLIDGVTTRQHLQPLLLAALGTKTPPPELFVCFQPDALEDILCLLRQVQKSRHRMATKPLSQSVGRVRQLTFGAGIVHGGFPQKAHTLARPG